MKYSLRTLLSVVLGVACALMAWRTYYLENNSPPLPVFEIGDVFQAKEDDGTNRYWRIELIRLDGSPDHGWLYQYDVASDYGPMGWHSGWMQEEAILDPGLRWKRLYAATGQALFAKQKQQAIDESNALSMKLNSQSKGTP